MLNVVKSTYDKEFKFIEKLRDCYLVQHLTEPTRGRGTNEPSLLDLVLTGDDLNDRESHCTREE